SCPSPAVVALTEGVLRSMFLTKLNSVAAVLALLCLAGLVAGLLSGPSAAQTTPRSTRPEGATEPANTRAAHDRADPERRLAELEKRVLALTNAVEELRGGRKPTDPKPDPGGRQTRRLPLKYKAAEDVAADIVSKLDKRVDVEVDPRRNTLIVTGSAKELELVDLILAEKDVPAKAAPPETPELNTYGVGTADASEVVRLLDKLFPEKTFRAAAVGNNRIMVYGTQADL